MAYLFENSYVLHLHLIDFIFVEIKRGKSPKRDYIGTRHGIVTSRTL